MVPSLKELARELAVSIAETIELFTPIAEDFLNEAKSEVEDKSDVEYSNEVENIKIEKKNLRLVFFGHSIGAFVALEVARLLNSEHGVIVDHFIASQARAPQVSSLYLISVIFELWWILDSIWV